MVWDALEAGGYGPHGRPDDFRSRCPGHDGDNREALHVTVSSDGTVLLYCFAGCRPQEIVEPLSLRLRDLFPVDPGDSRRRLRTARRDDFAGNAKIFANVLLACEQLGERWSGALWLDECPNCEWPYVSLSINSSGEPVLRCQRGCDLRMVEQALADRVRTRTNRRAA
jgi:hypothetical protein